jgi:hypothetical protein
MTFRFDRLGASRVAGLLNAAMDSADGNIIAARSMAANALLQAGLESMMREEDEQVQREGRAGAMALARSRLDDRMKMEGERAKIEREAFDRGKKVAAIAAGLNALTATGGQLLNYFAKNEDDKPKDVVPEAGPARREPPDAVLGARKEALSQALGSARRSAYEGLEGAELTSASPGPVEQGASVAGQGLSQSGARPPAVPQGQQVREALEFARGIQIPEGGSMSEADKIQLRKREFLDRGPPQRRTQTFEESLGSGGYDSLINSLVRRAGGV